MNNKPVAKIESIQNQIHTVRGVQVMLDEDLAELYQVGVKILNQAVKRNAERFPVEFMFQLTGEEGVSLRSQSVTLERGRGKHRKYLPHAFTEQGVAMLSAVLRSETAVKMSIQIINAFVEMRRFIANNAQIFQRLGALEVRQFETDKKMDQVLNAIESGEIKPKQGIFFDGQIFDAYQFVADLIRTAKKSVLLIDNYVDDTVLTLFAKRKKEVSLTILAKSVSKQMELDVKKFNDQYPPAKIKIFGHSHDRFLIFDDSTVYHFGASLKDLGRKWFAFSKMDKSALEILSKLEGVL